MKSKPDFSFSVLCAMLLTATSLARAGWYEIGNYAGTIGSMPVHLSLQSYDVIDRNEPVNGMSTAPTTTMRIAFPFRCRVNVKPMER
jgi:hypothetical protein